MTKCFLTDKTYPDYQPTDQEQRQDFQRELYKTIGSWGDFVNDEQTQLGIECAKLLVNLNNNNPDAFKLVLSAINMMVHKRTPDQKHHVNTVRAPVFKTAVAEIAEYILEDTYLDPILVTDDNGDERYTDEAQERFNEHHDAVEGVLSEYFQTDDVCRNGKPIADCECC